MFKVSPASLRIFIDTPNCFLEDRVQFSTVYIPNVFRDRILQLISCVGIVLYCNRQVHRDFLITRYKRGGAQIPSKHVEFYKNKICYFRNTRAVLYFTSDGTASHRKQKQVISPYKVNFALKEVRTKLITQMRG